MITKTGQEVDILADFLDEKYVSRLRKLTPEEISKLSGSRVLAVEFESLRSFVRACRLLKGCVKLSSSEI
jgi:hypothetical protein